MLISGESEREVIQPDYNQVIGQFYIGGQEVRRSIDCLLKRLIKVGDPGFLTKPGGGMCMWPELFLENTITRRCWPGVHRWPPHEGFTQQKEWYVKESGKNFLNLDAQPFHQERKPRPGFRPGNRHLQNPEIRTLDGRNPGMQLSLELASVQMPPYSFSPSIPIGQCSIALGKRPLYPRGMVKLNIHAVLSHEPIYSFYKPWFFQTQNFPVKVGGQHLNVPPVDSLSTTYPPTENPEGPE